MDRITPEHFRAHKPLLDARIDWTWFIASQFAFGIVAGLVVVRQERVRTRQFVPFLIRAGIEAPGLTTKNQIGTDHDEIPSTHSRRRGPDRTWFVRMY